MLEQSAHNPVLETISTSTQEKPLDFLTSKEEKIRAEIYERSGVLLPETFSYESSTPIRPEESIEALVRRGEVGDVIYNIPGTHIFTRGRVLGAHFLSSEIAESGDITLKMFHYAKFGNEKGHDSRMGFLNAHGWEGIETKSIWIGKYFRDAQVIGSSYLEPRNFRFLSREILDLLSHK